MKQFRPPFFVLLIVLLAMFACGESGSEDVGQVAEPTMAADEQAPAATESEASAPTQLPPPTEPLAPADTPVPPEPTPSPLGMSRGNPAPRSEVMSAPNWDVQVLEVMRGNEAWQAVKAANEFNQPPEEGMEYVSVKLRATSTYGDDEAHSIAAGDFAITGDSLILNSSAFVVEPEPALDAWLFSGGETEGWATYAVPHGEGSLILVADELMSYGEGRIRFIAIDGGAAIGVPPELAGIQSTETGKERSSAAPLGEMVTSEDWEVTILEVMRGDEAWAMAQEANEFNDPPAEGMEYLAVRVHARYIGTEDQATGVGSGAFRTTGDANVMYAVPMVVDPAPALDCLLYPGGECEGWVVLQAAERESGLMAVFEPLWDFSGQNVRFLALE